MFGQVDCAQRPVAHRLFAVCQIVDACFNCNLVALVRLHIVRFQVDDSCDVGHIGNDSSELGNVQPVNSQCKILCGKAVGRRIQAEAGVVFVVYGQICHDPSVISEKNIVVFVNEEFAVDQCRVKRHDMQADAFLLQAGSHP